MPEGWEIVYDEADLWTARWEHDGRRVILHIFEWLSGSWTWDFSYAHGVDRGEWHGDAPTRAEAITAARARAAKEGLIDG